MTGGAVYSAYDLVAHASEMTPQEFYGKLFTAGFGLGTAVALFRQPGMTAGGMFNPLAIRDGLLETYPPPVTLDRSIHGNGVRIDFRTRQDGGPLRGGDITGIRYGPDATPADIAAHVETALGMQRNLTLEPRIARWGSQIARGGIGDPPQGTAGWAAQQDIAKLQRRIEAWKRELQTPGLPKERSEEIDHDIAGARLNQSRLARDIDSYETALPGSTIDGSRAFLQAKKAGAEKAALEALARLGHNPKMYTFDGSIETGLKLVPRTGVPGRFKLPEFDINLDGHQRYTGISESRSGVWPVNGRLPLSTEYAGELLPVTALSPRRQAQYNDALEQLPESMRSQYRAGIRFNDNAEPQFPSVYETLIPAEKVNAEREDHFQIANEELLRTRGAELLRRGLSQGQVDRILASVRLPNGGVARTSPADWTWHHQWKMVGGQKRMELILVPRGIHGPIPHTGSFSDR
jgi:hypothetical protein